MRGAEDLNWSTVLPCSSRITQASSLSSTLFCMLETPIYMRVSVLVCGCARMCVCARERVCAWERAKEKIFEKQEKETVWVCVCECVCACACLILCNVFVFGACVYEHTCGVPTPSWHRAHILKHKTLSFLPEITLSLTSQSFARTSAHVRARTCAYTHTHTHAHAHARARTPPHARVVLRQLPLPLVSSTRLVSGCSSPVSLTYTARNEILTNAKFLR